jgi:hypothetical protein
MTCQPPKVGRTGVGTGVGSTGKLGEVWPADPRDSVGFGSDEGEPDCTATLQLTTVSERTPSRAAGLSLTPVATGR